jgi:glycosyltransferase involved in cell wall biosynthesis
MTFGVVVPSYNQARFLHASITSCLNHEVPVQIVVMDGGSTDESTGIIKELESKILYWRSGKDGGQAAAINSGVAHLKTDYIAWLNSDDCFTPGALSRIARCAEKYSPDVIYGNHLSINERGHVIGRHYHPPWNSFIVKKVGPYICQPGTFIRNCTWARVGGLNPNLHCVMDTDLWLRINKAGGVFSQVDYHLAKFRIHQTSKGMSWKAQYATEYGYLKREYQLENPPRRLHLGAYYIWKWITRLTPNKLYQRG